jgi:7,8-dihydro-6-hydroxymethylpterin-pyrophosphokinase
MKTKFEQWEQEWRRVMPEVLKQQEERRSKIAPEFQNEVREMATRMSWQELLELQQQIEAQAKQLELRAWFVGHVAYELLLAEFAKRKVAA